MMPAIILFDGVCNFCNSTVQWLMKHEKSSELKFGALQSEAGQKLLESFGERGTEVSSILFIENGKLYKRSTAALRITKYLRAPARWLGALIIFPRFIRDLVYDFIAARRYKWFGRQEACTIPSPEQRSRFI